MNDAPSTRGPAPAAPADPHPGLGTAALAAVVTGVVLLAAAAFVLSYAGIHQIALSAGVSRGLARVYPLIFDAMLVIASAAALALRGAGWWTRAYVWLSLLALLAAVAAADAAHAMGISLPARPSAAAVAVIPWALVLVGFGLWLAMLRHVRRARAARPGRAETAGPAAAGPGGAALAAAGPALAAGPRGSGPPAPGPALAAGPGSSAPPAPGPALAAGPGSSGAQAPGPSSFDRVRSTPIAPEATDRHDDVRPGGEARSGGPEVPAGPAAGTAAGAHAAGAHAARAHAAGAGDSETADGGSRDAKSGDGETGDGETGDGETEDGGGGTAESGAREGAGEAGDDGGTGAAGRGRPGWPDGPQQDPWRTQ